MKRIILFIMMALVAAGYGFSQQPNYQQILEDIDNSATFEGTDFSCTYTIVSQKPEEGKDITKARIFRRDSKDKFVLIILQPEVQKGQGYLKIDDNVWFYDPESRKFAHSSMKENLQDSDAKNSDFTQSSLVDDYKIVSTDSSSSLGRYDVHIIELEATNNEVSYPGMKLWISKENNLILKSEEYSLSGRLLRSSYYPKYKKVEGRYIPSKMLFIDELRKGEKTQVNLDDISLEDLPDSVFTKQYLERVNQ